MKKIDSIRKHAKNRLLERFGIVMTQKVHDDIIHQIRSGKAKFVLSASNRVSMFDVTIDNKTVSVVYDKMRGMIVTFLRRRRYGVGKQLRDTADGSGKQYISV